MSGGKVLGLQLLVSTAAVDVLLSCRPLDPSPPLLSASTSSAVVSASAGAAECTTWVVRLLHADLERQALGRPDALTEVGGYFRAALDPDDRARVLEVHRALLVQAGPELFSTYDFDVRRELAAYSSRIAAACAPPEPKTAAG